MVHRPFSPKRRESHFRKAGVTKKFDNKKDALKTCHTLFTYQFDHFLVFVHDYFLFCYVAKGLQLGEHDKETTKKNIMFVARRCSIFVVGLARSRVQCMGVKIG